LFHSDKGTTYIIHTFPLTEEGERAAKTMALKLADIAWGRTAGGEKSKANQEKVSNREKNSHPT
jgi:broad specificity phosphatase PhoE